MSRAKRSLSRWRLVASLAIASVLCLLRCSPTETPPPIGSGPGVEGGAPADTGSQTDGAARPDSSTRPGVDAGLGVGVVDVPNTPCSSPGGTRAQVLGADAGVVPQLRSLQAAGTRRVADFVTGQGFLLFDADGANATSTGAGTFARIYVASSAPGFSAASIGSAIGYQAYDMSGAETTSLDLTFDMTRGGPAIGASPTAALVAWGSAAGVTGRGVTGTMVAGAGPFDLALTSFNRALSLSVIDDGNGLFAYAFSGDEGGSTYQTVFGRATTTGRAEDPFILFSGTTPRQVVQLVKTPSGYGLLIVAGDPSPFAGLVLLGPLGNVTSIHRLDGAVDALAIAALPGTAATELGVAAIVTTTSDSGATMYAPEFRAFDATGAPLGPWVCLQDPVAALPASPGAGLAADGTGYAAIVNANDGSAVLERFDHLGTGKQ